MKQGCVEVTCRTVHCSMTSLQLCWSSCLLLSACLTTCPCPQLLSGAGAYALLRRGAWHRPRSGHRHCCRPSGWHNPHLAGEHLTGPVLYGLHACYEAHTQMELVLSQAMHAKIAALAPCVCRLKSSHLLKAGIAETSVRAMPVILESCSGCVSVLQCPVRACCHWSF